jgi:hypothetical protein
MRRLFNWLREEIPWLRRWKVEDQIAFSGDIEFDEETGEFRSKPSELPPEQPSNDGA